MTCVNYVLVSLEKKKKKLENSQDAVLRPESDHVASLNTEQLPPPTVCSALKGWPPS